MPSTNFKGAIWTHHALERIGSRGLTQNLAASAFTNPDVKIKGKNPGTTEFRKKVQNSTITIIGKQNEKYEWVIISCWIDPPLEGTEDYKKRQAYLKYKKASGWGKFFYSLRKQLGL